MMTRKQFLGSLAGLLGASALLGACKSDDGGDPTPDAAAGGGGGGGGGNNNPDAAVMMPDAPMQTACTTASSTIGTNHGHTLVVPQTDLDAGVDKTYNIQGTSAHPHTVVVTAAMWTMLKANRSVQITSSNDAGHTHSVTITC